MDLPAREYYDEKIPSRRLAHRQETENSWWRQWSVQCFDSLLPTQAWNQKKRGVRAGDIVLVSYQDKSKTGTFRLGRVESVEVDKDGLVRTCTVQYRIVRADLPMEDMRIYFKGLAFKFLRVPVQRLVVILPVEEQGGQGQAVDEKGDERVQCEETDENNHKELELQLNVAKPNILRAGSYVIWAKCQIIKTSLDFRYQLVGEPGELGRLVQGEDAIFLNLLII